jgi:hypothetical protein
MKNLQLCFEFYDWLGLVFVVDYHHAPANVFSYQLLICFYGLYTNASQFASISFITVYSVDMDGLDHYLLEILQNIRAQKTLFV